jgi:Protein of unknown function (DUF1800)
VTSGNTVPPQGMTPYMRLLLQDAFANYWTLTYDVTLSPAMGRYLDMVNNDKPPTGTRTNENYAREFMQLSRWARSAERRRHIEARLRPSQRWLWQIELPMAIAADWDPKWSPLFAGLPIELVHTSEGFSSDGRNTAIVRRSRYVFDPGSRA